MTHREFFNRRKRIWMAWFLGVLLVGISTGWVSVHEELEWLFLVAYVSIPCLFIVLWAAVLFGVRCPSCGSQWGWIAMYSGSPIAIRRQLIFCPYCAVHLDDPVAADEAD
jgi:hypothetical protein